MAQVCVIEFTHRTQAAGIDFVCCSNTLVELFCYLMEEKLINPSLEEVIEKSRSLLINNEKLKELLK